MQNEAAFCAIKPPIGLDQSDAWAVATVSRQILGLTVKGNPAPLHQKSLQYQYVTAPVTVKGYIL